MDDLKDKLPLHVTGRVVKGFGRGSRELGIPTANMDQTAVDHVAQSGLPNGVYYGLAQLESQPPGTPSNQSGKLNEFFLQDRKVLPMVANIGTCPQYDNPAKSVEVHIIKLDDSPIPEDFYGQVLRVAFQGWLRGEDKFDSLQALIDQIHRDVEEAKSLALEELV